MPTYVLLFISYLLLFTLLWTVRKCWINFTLILNKSLAWVVGITLLIGIYLFGLNLAQTKLAIPPAWPITLGTIIYGIFCAQFFHPLRLYIQALGEKNLSKVLPNYPEILVRLSKKLSSCTSIEDLHTFVHQTLCQELELEQTSILLPEQFWDPSHRTPHHYFELYKTKLNPHSVVTLSLNHHPELWQKMIHQDSILSLRKELPWKPTHWVQNGYSLALPCICQHELLAIVLIGNRKNEELFSKNELRFMDTLGSEIGQVLDRIRTVEKIKTASLNARSYEEKLHLQHSYASLTMGIAHEIRNPMFNLLSRAEIIEKKINDPDAILKFSEMTKRNILRILAITDEMLTYGSPLSKEKAPYNLIDALESTLTILAPRLDNAHIQIDKKIHPIKPMLGDEPKIKQSLYNLILNAIEAMPNGGTLTITVTPSPFRNKVGIMLQGIEVRLQDSGQGMSSDTLGKAFNAFFTTKYDRKGLGLSVALKHVDMNGGVLDLHSEEGVGTTVSIYLPYLKN